MDVEYMDILTGEILSSIKVAKMDLIYWSVRLSSRKERDGVKSVAGRYHYFSQLKVSLY